MPDKGHVTLNGKDYRIDLATYRASDIVDLQQVHSFEVLSLQADFRPTSSVQPPDELGGSFTLESETVRRIFVDPGLPSVASCLPISGRDFHLTCQGLSSFGQAVNEAGAGPLDAGAGVAARESGRRPGISRNPTISIPDASDQVVQHLYGWMGELNCGSFGDGHTQGQQLVGSSHSIDNELRGGRSHFDLEIGLHQVADLFKQGDIFGSKGGASAVWVDVSIGQQQAQDPGHLRRPVREEGLVHMVTALPSSSKHLGLGPTAQRSVKQFEDFRHLPITTPQFPGDCANRHLAAGIQPDYFSRG